MSSTKNKDAAETVAEVRSKTIELFYKQPIEVNIEKVTGVFRGRNFEYYQFRVPCKSTREHLRLPLEFAVDDRVFKDAGMEKGEDFAIYKSRIRFEM